jgi:radical SAM protein with 4Fe4S-binding SPASM domain
MSVAGAYIAHTDKAWSYPVMAAIEPTNICNLRCPLCATGAGILTRQSGSMPLDNFRCIADKLTGKTETLYLWGQGEPFLAPDFLSMVSYAARKGFRTIVSTNGHFLDNAEEIVNSGMSQLIVSLDGIDENSYTAYRYGGDFNRVIRGIRFLAEVKRREGHGPEIIIQYLLTASSAPKRREVGELASSLGADKVVLKTLQAAWLTGGDKSLPDDLNLTRYRRKSDGTLVTDCHPFLGKRCLRLYYSFQVDWQGNVVPCCFDKNSDHILGNILTSNLQDIWNNSTYKKFRRSMNNNGRVLPMCTDCTEGLKRGDMNG